MNAIGEYLNVPGPVDDRAPLATVTPLPVKPREYFGLKDVREMLELALDKPVTRQLAYRYTLREDFPAVVLTRPCKQWDKSEVFTWLQWFNPEMAEERRQVTVSAELRKAIRKRIMSAGGLKRGPDYWSEHLTSYENRRTFSYLDRVTGGVGIDDMAKTIAAEYPESGVYDADSLLLFIQEG